MSLCCDVFFFFFFFFFLFLAPHSHLARHLAVFCIVFVPGFTMTVQ